MFKLRLSFKQVVNFTTLRSSRRVFAPLRSQPSPSLLSLLCGRFPWLRLVAPLPCFARFSRLASLRNSVRVLSLRGFVYPPPQHKPPQNFKTASQFSHPPPGSRLASLGGRNVARFAENCLLRLTPSIFQAFSLFMFPVFDQRFRL